MSCNTRKIISPITGKEVESKTWKDIYGLVDNDAGKADKLYEQLLSPGFLSWFGDWIHDPKNASKVVNEHGEPLIVYHGTKVEFDTFDLNRSGNNLAAWERKAINFTSDKDVARMYAESFSTGQNTLELIEGYFIENPDAIVIRDGKEVISRDFVRKEILQTFPNRMRRDFRTKNGEFVLDESGMKIWDDERYITDRELERMIDENVESLTKDLNDVNNQKEHILPVLLNIKSPFIKDYKGEEKDDDFRDNSLSNTGDGFIAKNLKDWGKVSDVYRVFEAHQIKSIFNNGQFLNKTNNVYFQTEHIESSSAAHPTLSRVRNFLAQIGAKETTGENLSSGVNGLADALKGLVSVAAGKEDVALTEEAMHLAVELLEQKNPTLFRQLFNKIGSYQLYTQVLREYGKNAAYQQENGKPDIVKIKKEAIGKVLAEYVIKQEEGSTEKPELIEQTKDWWTKILDFLKELFGKAANPFEEAADTVLNDTESLGTVADLKNSGVYYQLTGSTKEQWEKDHPKQTEIWQKLDATQSKVIKDVSEDNTTNRYIIPAEGDREVERRVSQVVHQKMGSPEFEKTQKRDFLADFGTKIHADMEGIIRRYTDEDGFLRLSDTHELLPTEAPAKEATNTPYYTVVESYLRDMFTDFASKEETRGVRIRPETVVYQPKGGQRKELAGTIDFLAVFPDGRTAILDWKGFEHHDKYPGVPWFKTEHVRIQLGEYHRMLKDHYGVRTFGQQRGIPIALKVVWDKDTKGYKVTSFQIGKYDTKAEFREHLIPIATPDEQTGIPALDKLIGQLSANLAAIRETDLKKTGKTKAQKNAEIEAVLKAIAQLKINQHLMPTIGVGETVLQSVKDYLSTHNEDVETLSAEVINAKLAELKDILDRAQPFVDIYKTLEGMAASPEDLARINALDRGMGSEYAKLLDYREKLVDKGARLEGISGILESETPIDTLGKYLTAASAGLKKAAAYFSRVAGRVNGIIQFRLREEAENLSTLYAAAEKEGSLQAIMAPERNGKYVHQLLRRFKKEFYDKLKARVEESTNAHKKDSKEYQQFLKDNIDIAAFKAHMEEKRARKLQEVADAVYSFDEKEQDAKQRKERERVEGQYNLDTEQAGGWYNEKELQKFPLKTWESDQWKELQKKPAALALYNYIVQRNLHAKEVGFLSRVNPYTFLPFKRKESHVGTVRSVAKETETSGIIRKDPITGKKTYSYPHSTTRSLEPEEQTRNLEQSMLEYNSQLINYEVKIKTEPFLEALLAVEESKKAYEVKKDGSVVWEGNTPKLAPDNKKNAAYLEDFIAMGWFEVRDIDEGGIGDRTIFTYGEGWDKTARWVNKKVGHKLMPENMAGKRYTAGQMVEGATNWYRMKALGLAVNTSISNYVGGRFQSWVNRKIFWNGGDGIRENGLMVSAASGNKESLHFLAMMGAQVPYTDLHRQRMDSAAGLRGIKVFNWLMKTHEWADRGVHASIATKMYLNAVVVDGKLVNAREWVNSKYPGKYQGTEAERKALEDKKEKEIEDLKKTSSLAALSTRAENGKWTFPVSEEDLAEYRRKTMNVIRMATGQMNEEERMAITGSMLGRSAITFKGWIPRLFMNRLQGINYNEAMDHLDWGRWKVFGSVFSHAKLSISTYIAIAKGTDEGIALMREMLEQKKLDYYRRHGRELNVTEDEFMDTVRAQMAGMYREVVLMLTLLGMNLALMAAAPDDDDKEAKGRYALAHRQLQKITQEMTFFYNPMDMQSMANGSVLPGLGLMIDASYLVKHLGKEVFGDSEKAHPLKYAIRMIPGLAQANTLTAYFWADYAKEMGVKVDGNPLIR